MSVTKVRPAAVPRTVIALGVVSLFMDISSEVIHSLLPAFLVTVLGVGALAVGVIEGIAEATASITKLFSGALSDWIGKRKPLILLGYGLAAATKPLFPLASGVEMVLVARFVDRIGKGIRDAPRDALIGDVTPEDARGASFGLRQSMDTLGAVIGPSLAMILMAASGDNFRFVFWIAVVPAAAAIAVIFFGVREPEAPPSTEPHRFPIRRAGFASLNVGYWWLIVAATVLALARFSEAFLLLAAQHVGMTVALVPSVLVTMNVVYAGAAYPFGRLSDRIGRRRLLSLGIVVLVLADIVLGNAGTVWQVVAGAALWGLHLGVTQGLLSALVVDAAPADVRGTALGFYGLITGIALLAASVLAGWLWTTVGFHATFIAGAMFAAVAAIAIASSPRQAAHGEGPTPVANGG